jgi:phosphotriesterase-related protein
MPIHTVLGPIEPDALGPTSMHEHCLIDARAWLRPAREEPPAETKVTLETLGFVRWNLVSLEDNLIMDDPEVAIRELSDVRALGGSGIVDLTTIGLGRRVDALPEIATRTGLHLMVGCGFYVDHSLPDWVRKASVDELTELLSRELREGLDGTGIRPALIGELGTGDPITDLERKVLHAAGSAGAEAGAAINVHLDPRGTHALEAVEILVAEGMEPGRVILSHMDEHLDRGYHRAVADAGAVLEYDTFGQEITVPGLFADPHDVDRLEYVQFLLEHGLDEQLVLGCDVWVKSAQRTFGGMGYEHLLKRIRPALEADFGVPSATVDRLLVDNPRRLLNRPT